MSKIICYSVLLLMYLRCGYTQEHTVNSIKFPYTEKINSISYKVPDVVFGKTPSLIVTKDYVIILRTYAEPFFQLFSFPDCKYLGGTGHKGGGPNEFELPDARTGSRTKLGFKVFDINKGYMYVDLTEYAKKKEMNVKVLKIPGELYMLNDAIQLNNKIISRSLQKT